MQIRNIKDWSPEEKALVCNCFEMRPVSFPNGSCYKEQRPKRGFDYSVSGGIFSLHVDGKIFKFPNKTIKVGPGTDFGKFYNSRDIVYEALQ